MRMLHAATVVMLVAIISLSTIYYFHRQDYWLTCSGYYNVHGKGLSLDAFVKNTWEGDEGSLIITGLLTDKDNEQNNIGLTTLFSMKRIEDTVELTATDHDMRLRHSMSETMRKNFEGLLPPFFYKANAKIIYTVVYDGHRGIILTRGKLPVFYCNRDPA